MKQQQKSLLFFAPEFGRRGTQGGVAVSAERYATHFSTHYNVHVVNYDDEVGNFQHVSHTQPHWRHHRLGRHRDPQEAGHHLYRFCSELLQEFQITEIVLFYVTAAATPLAFIAQVFKTKLSLVYRGNDFNLGLIGPELAMHHHLIANAERVITVNSAMQAAIKTIHPESNTSFIANGVDIGLFKPWQTEPKKTGFVVGLFGDIKVKKGLDVLLQAIDFESMSLRIVGHLRPELEKLLHGFLCLHPGAVSRIHVEERTDSVEKLQFAYAQCDVVVVPSYHEGMPNILLEAMAMGKVCVASATGGACDVITSNKYGFLFPCGDSAALAALLLSLKECDEQILSEISNAARDHIKSRFTHNHERELLLACFAAN